MLRSEITRRRLLKSALAAAPGAALASRAPRMLGQAIAAQVKPPRIATGPFQPTWDSLNAYKTPEWFRDAKFGIWNHWSAQCVPGQGDWYARNMYIQGNRQYDHHLKTYGHPSKAGFMELTNLWKAENWKPEELMDLYVAAGAKYFTALANHHDNFDTYNSRLYAVECGEDRAEEGHCRDLREDCAGARAAVCGVEPWLARVELAADGVQLRSRGADGGRALRRVHPDQGGRQGQVVGGA